MILALTLNPCLDKTLIVSNWQVGDSVRGRETFGVVGGKGNNVARALKRLGREVRPLTFLGGPTGMVCESLLKEVDQLDPIVIPTVSETRTILTVRTAPTNDQTAFFDPDPLILPNEATALLSAVALAMETLTIEAMTLSGSSPSETTHDLYGDLIALAKRRGVPVFLDTYGPALQRIAPRWPTAIQLNRREAGIFLIDPEPTEQACLGLLETWIAEGVESATITNGGGPALVAIGDQRFRVTPPAILPVNPIGSGDSMLAGFVDGRLHGLDPLSLIRHAFGAGTANALVWDAGAIDPAEVARQAERVVVEPLPKRGD